MNGVLLTALIGIVTTFASGFISYIFTRKKYNSEVDHNLIENMSKSLDFYKTLSDDNKVRLDILSEENERLREEVQDIRKQMLDLAMNICLDLTCVHRVVDPKKIQKDGEN